MKIRGRNLSNWWLLLLVPLLVCGFPLLLMLFFIGNNLAGAIAGPPAIWNRTTHSPPLRDLAGRYEGGQSASLLLNADGSMAVSGLPYEFYPMTCTLSGVGTWGERSNSPEDQAIHLRVKSDGKSGSCASGDYEELELAGHSKPYKLYWVIGDPDSGTGVWMNWVQ